MGTNFEAARKALLDTLVGVPIGGGPLWPIVSPCRARPRGVRQLCRRVRRGFFNPGHVSQTNQVVKQGEEYHGVKTVVTNFYTLFVFLPVNHLHCASLHA